MITHQQSTSLRCWAQSFPWRDAIRAPSMCSTLGMAVSEGCYRASSVRRVFDHVGCRGCASCDETGRGDGGGRRGGVLNRDRGWTRRARDGRAPRGLASAGRFPSLTTVASIPCFSTIPPLSLPSISAGIFVRELLKILPPHELQSPTTPWRADQRPPAPRRGQRLPRKRRMLPHPPGLLVQSRKRKLQLLQQPLPRRLPHANPS